jgi:hypothetical protein
MNIKAKCHYNDLDYLWSISLKTSTTDSCFLKFLFDKQNYKIQCSYIKFEEGWISIQKELLDLIYKTEKKRYHIEWFEENDEKQKLLYFEKKGILVQDPILYIDI